MSNDQPSSSAYADWTWARLLAELERLQLVMAEQAEQIASLTARVAELSSASQANSRNSSKPPSSDGYAKPAPKSRRKRSGRKPGKQPGAPGHHLARVAKADHVVDHVPPRCRSCRADLAGAPVVGHEVRQVFDLPPVRLVSTEHRAQRRACECGAVTTAEFPTGVGAPTQYGPRLRASATYLVGYQHLPYARAAECLADLCGVAVATGTLVNTLARGAAGLSGDDGFLARVRGLLAGAAVAHFDETGSRVDARLGWVHVAGTDRLTLYTIHRRRGVEAMDAAGVLPSFTGVACHDGWAPYRRYDKITHALCNAHHERELIAAAAGEGQDWAAGMGELLVEMHVAVEEAKAAGAPTLSGPALAAFLARYEVLIAAGYVTNPAPVPSGKRGRTKKTKAANLLGRLDVYRDDVTRFAADFRVNWDNNSAERDVRMIKVHDKVAGCWRSWDGAEAWLAVRSYISTARKQGQGVLDALHRLFAGQPWVPALADP